MKIHPTLFSTPMVQAIYEGRKTITRRTKGLEEINNNSSDWQFEWADFSLKKPWRFTQKSSLNEVSLKERSFYQAEAKCPYGQIGDILWVRETFCLTQPNNPEIYYFGYKTGGYSYEPASEKYSWSSPDEWKPSIHMPKEACRIFLKITDIKVERIQEISEEDAKAEGVEPEFDAYHQFTFYKTYTLPKHNGYHTAKLSFESLWKSINGPDSWNSNPWVWVISFERCEKPENF